MNKENLTVLSQEKLTSKIFKMKLQGDSVKTMLTPGQFVHLKVGERHPVLRRPISICSVKADILTIVYRIEGQGTKLLNQKAAGDTVDTLGPLGKGFPLTQESTALLVGGGVGIPPLLYLAEQLYRQGTKVKVILGYRKKEEIFLVEEFQKYGEVFITTEDGSYGRKGFVTDAIAEAGAYDVFYTCGPKPMLRAVETASTKKGYISLEERMGCGVGACLACVCDKQKPFEGKAYVKACRDGPVFEAGEVIV
ncbi:MAG: dihydroorotate dehydrogenase electron transfer subunit [Alkalicoccus sp.]|nr:MAG: dihydroorotate dehydrogenase electron transfer subunit [Alkalicoccus sp.]